MKMKTATAVQNILESGENNKLKLIEIIDSFPGIRYNDLVRLTGFNNGTLSYHLAILEKYSVIRKLRLDNSSNMTRYYLTSVSSEETIIVEYLKIKSTNQIIKLLLQDRK